MNIKLTQEQKLTLIKKHSTPHFVVKRMLLHSSYRPYTQIFSNASRTYHRASFG